ncbi:hypothetical protein V1478_010450 [Vespula squamosa]|uniref:Uncharacterized protein n=1 Tax=Vespula squamosa TaxID=30214 RepID=A0ABD2AHU2_VESSQ
MGDVTIVNFKETDLNIFVRTKVKKQDEEQDLRWFKCRRESKVSRLIVSSPRTLTSSSKKVVSSKQPPSFGQTLFLYLSRYHGSSEKVGRGFAELSNTMVYLERVWITITSGVTNLAQVEETGGTRETPIIVTAVALRPLLLLGPKENLFRLSIPFLTLLPLHKPYFVVAWLAERRSRHQFRLQSFPVPRRAYFRIHWLIWKTSIVDKTVQIAAPNASKTSSRSYITEIESL